MERIDLRRLPGDWSAEDRELLQAVEDASATPIYVEYRISREWFEGIESVIDDLEARLDSRPKVVLTLIERLLVRLDRADVDDSGGGTVAALRRLGPVYAEAGRALEEDRASLGKRVAELDLDFDFDL